MENAAHKEDQGRGTSRAVIRPFGSHAVDPPSAEGIDLSQLWSALKERHRFVLGVGVALFCAIMLVTMSSRMAFKTSGRLYLGELETKARASGSGELDLTGGSQGDIGSEIEILKSQSLVTTAILDSGLNVTIVPSGWSPPRLWHWLWAGRDPNVLDVPARELAVTGATLSDGSRGAQSYRVRFTTADHYELWSRSQLLATGKLGEALEVRGVKLTLHPGTQRGPESGASYELSVRPIDETEDEVLDALAVTAPKPALAGEAAKVLTLEFTHASPQLAASFLRRLMSGYLNARQSWKTEDASAAEAFVTGQLSSLRKSLDKTEQKLADYRSNTRVVVLDNEAKAMIEQVGKYEEQRVAARLQVAALADMKRALKLPKPPTEAFLFGEARDTVLEERSTTLANARQTLSELEAQFGPNDPQTRKQRGQVETQLQMIEGYVSTRLARAQENLNALNKIIAQFEEKLKTVPGAELGLAQLGRESEVYSRVYSYMLERQQQAAIVKASTVSKNRILDFPHVPYREDAPKLALRLASGPLALLFAALVVLVQRFFAVSLQSDSDVQASLGGVPVFSSIPRRPKARARTSGVQSEPEVESWFREAGSGFVEAFRTLRTNLYQWGARKPGRIVLITSPSPGDGKTTSSFALAAVLAADKKRVLLVDADLRKPSHHGLTGQLHLQGLRNVLAGQQPWREVVQTVPLSIGSFDSIAAGRAAPAELLSGERMARFLEDARIGYDFVLLDSPSFPLVSDALVLSNTADFVLSVVRLQHTPRKLASEHVRRLSAAALTYGLVVNDTRFEGATYPSPPGRALPPFVRTLLWKLRRAARVVARSGSPLANVWLAVCALLVGVAAATAIRSLHPTRSKAQKVEARAGARERSDVEARAGARERSDKAVVTANRDEANAKGTSGARAAAAPARAATRSTTTCEPKTSSGQACHPAEVVAGPKSSAAAGSASKPMKPTTGAAKALVSVPHTMVIPKPELTPLIITPSEPRDPAVPDPGPAPSELPRPRTDQTPAVPALPINPY